MEILELLPPSKRGDKVCYLCNETRSVKYLIELEDYNLAEDDPGRKMKAYCCNLCVFRAFGDKYEI